MVVSFFVLFFFSLVGVGFFACLPPFLLFSRYYSVWGVLSVLS